MYTYRVLRVDKVVDGDTVDVTIDLGFNLSLRQRFRVVNVNAPEMRADDPAVRARAAAAKAFAEQWFASNGKMVVTSYKDDKYGRMLGDFRREHSAESFSEALLSSGNAERYSPGG